MNTILLIILIAACSYMELSQKINTDDIIEKFSVLIIVLGAGLIVFKVSNSLMLYGSVAYFVNLSYKGFKSKHDRRKQDHTPKRRKILS